MILTALAIPAAYTSLSGILTLLFDFLQIGFFSIGGGYAVIPLIKSHVVDLRHWLTLRQFTDIITISQMTPGPLAVNTSTFVGLQTGGIPGAIAATFGCIFSGFVISLLLCRFFDRYRASTYGSLILNALKAASLGLIAAAAATILTMAFSAEGESAARIPISLSGMNLCAILLFSTSFFGIRRIHLNPMLVITLCGVLGYFLYQ